MIFLTPVILILLIILLVVTVYSDIKFNRIKNFWVFLSTLLAFTAHLILGGWNGFAISLLGFIVGLGLFLPFYIIGGMAAGDVKLMATVGALLGVKLAWIAVIFTLISGGLLALAYLLFRGDLMHYLKRWLTIFSSFLISFSISSSYLNPANDEVASLRFPYALAIATGAVLSLLWFVHLLPSYMLISY